MGILQEVKRCGQEVWLDKLSRSLLRGGALAAYRDMGVSGLTSNPAIFRQAFAEDAAYAEEIVRLRGAGRPPQEIYETLAAADIREACAVFLPLHRDSDGRSGWVSWEVSPAAAHDAEATLAEARRLSALVGCGNLMVKIPATRAGLQALSMAAAEGISVNLTLLFSLCGTDAAFAAFAEGLRRRAAAGGDLAGVQMVASYFVSRTDAALDVLLPEDLRGRMALALAAEAYRRQTAFVRSSEWSDLAEMGAAAPRLLWASTGVKNPAYPDTLYADGLVAADTVNTMPEAVLAAFLDHGRAVPALEGRAEEAAAVLARIAALGVDLEVLAVRLQEDGLRQFEEAHTALLAALAA